VRRDEILAGAPILRGRWSALAFTWWSGWLFGRVHPITDTITGHDLDKWDYFLAPVGLGLLILAMVFLDQYGRNCWFSWAPDDQLWAKKLHRNDVKRESWTTLAISWVRGLWKTAPS
jgi:hypothetical protein